MSEPIPQRPTEPPIHVDAGCYVDLVITGAPDEHYTIRVEHLVDQDDDHAIQLGGLDCQLAGELPGLYYPEPVDPERFGLRAEGA